MKERNKNQVTHLILHHAVTPQWSNKSKRWLAQWFSDNGKARAYNYGNTPTNLVNYYTGKPSYAQAQYAGQRVTSATPDATKAEKQAGYRLVPLVKNPFEAITWHAGNWDINTKSIGIENLGDYRNYTLRDGDVKVIADFWRDHDRSLGGDTFIMGHKQVSQSPTACPARVMERLQDVIDAVNQSQIATPKPKKAEIKYEKLATTITYELIKDSVLWDFSETELGLMTSIKSFKKGQEVEIYAKATHPSGNVYLMTKYSYDKRMTTGFNVKDLQEDKPEEPEKPDEPDEEATEQTTPQPVDKGEDIELELPTTPETVEPSEPTKIDVEFIETAEQQVNTTLAKVPSAMAGRLGARIASQTAVAGALLAGLLQTNKVFGNVVDMSWLTPERTPYVVGAMALVIVVLTEFAYTKKIMKWFI